MAFSNNQTAASPTRSSTSLALTKQWLYFRKSLPIPLRETKDDEMSGLVGTLDITDSQLCSNYHSVSEYIMAEEIRFGRIASLFFFTYALSKCLHGEGRQKETQSLVDWLTAFLNERIAPWLVQNHQGDWAAFLPGPTPIPSKTAGSGMGWITMAVLGVGAFAVGALSFKS